MIHNLNITIDARSYPEYIQQLRHAFFFLLLLMVKHKQLEPGRHVSLKEMGERYGWARDNSRDKSDYTNYPDSGRGEKN